MIEIRLVIEIGDETIELKQGTSFVHPGDAIDAARAMLVQINDDARQWFAARDRPPAGRARPIRDNPQA